MKYGDQLEQESVPEWSLHNIDYNSLKHEIKVHTTRNQATAIAIPGHQDTALEKFENSLFLELSHQHGRVQLFVTSKADEISRRLNHLSSQIQRLINKCNEDNGGRIPFKRQRKFARYERDVLKCGEEINSLSRFTTAQVTAFRKITKKYKKWTGSSALGARFRENVLSNPKSFTRRDFSQLRLQYDTILTTLRNTSTSFSEPSSPSSDEQPILSSRDATAPRSKNQRVEFTPLPPPETHYWNEYDDGSEAGGDDGGYAIYINPDDDTGFPGLASLRTAIVVPFDKIRSLLGLPRKTEREPLLPTAATSQRNGAGIYGATATAATNSDEEYYSSSDEQGYPSLGFAAHYAALPSVDAQLATRYREKTMLWGTIGCFGASFILLGVAGVLIATGRHRMHIEVDAGVTIGAVASLCCACLALGMTLYRRDPLSIMYRVAVGVTFLTCCVLNGMLLVLVVGSSI